MNKKKFTSSLTTPVQYSENQSKGIICKLQLSAIEYGLQLKHNSVETNIEFTRKIISSAEQYQESLQEIELRNETHEACTETIYEINKDSYKIGKIIHDQIKEYTTRNKNNKDLISLFRSINKNTKRLINYGERLNTSADSLMQIYAISSMVKYIKLLIKEDYVIMPIHEITIYDKKNMETLITENKKLYNQAISLSQEKCSYKGLFSLIIINNASECILKNIKLFNKI